MIKNVLCVSFLLGACADIPAVKEELGLKNKRLDNSVSVCYNIDSEEHGKPCSEACLELGNQHIFCWEMYPEDCRGQVAYEWQKQNCHFFD
ncbi:MAG: hypothetical protein CMA72_09060 [Euryarchaeota archaeon]|nr:hypothetical protein [Euryarchaeota archaeon]|tara:strand:- start:823 stop:1095 length:273 start_codon:yes stop_codon:yes gene_type:complete